VVKAAVRSAKSQGAKVVSRVLPIPEVDAWDDKVRGMVDEIEDVLKEEKEEKLLTVVERDVRRGENLVVHESEIKGRPRRTWFESEKEKLGAKEAGKRELNGELPPKKKGKLSNKEKKKMDLKDERMDGRMWKKGKGDGQLRPSATPGKAGKAAAGKGGKSKLEGARERKLGSKKGGRMPRDAMPSRKPKR
jgi:ATP-dependent RNA helicase DDX27